jgi:hypothetical protein
MWTQPQAAALCKMPAEISAAKYKRANLLSAQESQRDQQCRHAHREQQARVHPLIDPSAASQQEVRALEIRYDPL